MSPPYPPPDTQRGSVTAELVLITPILLALLGLLALGGRVAAVRGAVDAAARDAARAASTARDPRTARTQAAHAAHASLSTPASCPQPDVTVDLAGFQPGGRVTAAVTCRLRLTDLAALPLPGRLTLRAEAVSVIDRYRGVSAASTPRPSPRPGVTARAG